MILKPLGRTNEKIAEIGQGTWNYRGGVEPLRLGVSLGSTHIDTAEMYGTEEAVGRAIEGIRENVFLATKVWHDHLHYDDLLKACEGSLNRLRVNQIDLYMIHWPNSRVPIKESMRAMEELVRRGKIRHIGLSNFSVSQLKEAQEALSSHDIVSNQVEYNLGNREIEKDIIPHCKKEKITVIAYSPIKGLELKSRNDVVQEIATRNGKTRAQVMLNFLTAEENVVAIPKAGNIDHIRENCGASGWRLSKDDMQLISDSFP